MKTNETILPATVYNMEYHNLLPHRVYNIIAQTITKYGIKETLRTSFKTSPISGVQKAKKQDSSLNKNVIDELKSEYERDENRNNLEMETLSVDRIIELPLEGGGSEGIFVPSIRWYLKPLYLMFMFWVLRLRLFV